MFHNISENAPGTYIGKPDDKAYTLQPLVLFFLIRILIDLRAKVGVIEITSDYKNRAKMKEIKTFL